MSDLAQDPRVAQLNERIQNEKDPQKLVQLTEELLPLIDESTKRKGSDGGLNR